MRILIVHNRYQHPGGEDAVFTQEQALLSATESVFTFQAQNHKGWRGAWQTFWAPYNIWAARRLKRAIRQHRPDVIHIHNLHYAIGPVAIRVAKRCSIPVVMTLHNYRLLCPSATLFHRGQLFTDSLSANFPWKAVWQGVHTGSVLKTWWLAWTTWLHKALGTWHQVDHYIALTLFAKQLFSESSLAIPAAKLVVKPNFVAATPLPTSTRSPHFLFIGRLTEEKGILLLLHAFAGTNDPLRIAGDGPLLQHVVEAAEKNKNITYLGTLASSAIGEQLASCTALIFPSIWYEGMPITLLEAFAAGTPVIASNLGAMQSMIVDGHTGRLFLPGSVEALRQAIADWQALPAAARATMGQQAHATYQHHYTPAANKTQLLAIYRAVQPPIPVSAP